VRSTSRACNSITAEERLLEGGDTLLMSRIHGKAINMHHTLASFTVIIACAAAFAFTTLARPASGQDPKAERVTPALTARIEVDEHEHCFTVRFFLKNTGEKDIAVIYGVGGGGLEVVPQFKLAGLTVTPPKYLHPPRRSMRPDAKHVPAGEEILYGTFTMGYPPVERDQDREETLSGSIYFRELKAELRTEPRTLKIPAQTTKP
jgi:hypothetical protein